MSQRSQAPFPEASLFSSISKSHNKENTPFPTPSSSPRKQRPRVVTKAPTDRLHPLNLETDTQTDMLLDPIPEDDNVPNAEPELFEAAVETYRKTTIAPAASSNSKLFFVFFDKTGKAFPSQPPEFAPLIQQIISAYNDIHVDDFTLFINSAFQAPYDTTDRRERLRRFILEDKKPTTATLSPFYEATGTGRDQRFSCLFLHQDGNEYSYGVRTDCVKHIKKHLSFEFHPCYGTETHPKCQFNAPFQSIIQEHYKMVPVMEISNVAAIPDPDVDGNTAMILAEYEAPENSEINPITPSLSLAPVTDLTSVMTSADLLEPQVEGQTPLEENPPTRFRTKESLEAYVASCFRHTSDPMEYRNAMIRIMSKKKIPLHQDLLVFMETIPKSVTNKKETFRCRICDTPGSPHEYAGVDGLARHIRGHHIQYYTFPCTSECGVTECTRIFPTTMARLKHKNARTIECDICGMTIRADAEEKHKKLSLCMRRAAKKVAK